MGGVEPQLVALDRPAESASVVVDLLELGHVGESARSQCVGQVVALQRAIRILDVADSREGVAAGLGHHIELHTA